MGDEGSGPLPGFEGVEKNLEVDFVPGVGPERGLRLITRAQWDTILEAAKCSILDTLSNASCDSYVLSESSLFVYSHKMILKTCGTTTLLRCLDLLVEATKALGMKVEWLAYTRKDFIFPTVQKFPHRDPNEEVNYLKERYPEGHAFVMGPLTGDHWFVFVADYLDRSTDNCVDRTLDMMMFGIDEDVAKLFLKDKARFPKDSDVTRASGISNLLPGSQIQEFCFDPCGYSMNGLLFDAYWTIHITPESHCSYASFETNVRMTNFTPLIKAVLAIFRPRKFTMTLFADERGLRAVKESPFAQVLTVPLIDTPVAAVLGPCVLVSEPSGESYVSYPKPAPSSLVDNRDAFGVARPSDADKQELVAAVSDAVEGATTSATAVVSPTSVVTSAAPPAPISASSNSSSNNNSSASSVSSRRSKLLGGAPVGSGGPGLAAYVMSNKCHTEFVGEYHSLLGNFKLVPTTTAAQMALGMDSSSAGSRAGGGGTPRAGGGLTSSSSSAELGVVASEALALPRVKYVVERELSRVAAQGKIRTESI